MISPWYMVHHRRWPPVADDPSVVGDGSGELQSDLELLPVPSSAPGRGPGNGNGQDEWSDDVTEDSGIFMDFRHEIS